MKKVFTLMVAVSMLSLIACGPSKEELAAKEKAKQDSIAKAQKELAVQDSLTAVAKAKEDSIAKATAKEDSIKAAAEAKKAPKGGKKVKK
ncbi:MAG: hypothetical protein WCQ95_02775 [Bacteroidota bacterium]